MATSMVLGRLLLAAVFATAGLGKLRDLPGSRRAVAEFGVPSRLAAPLGILLPAAELTVAGALVADPTAAWGALAALALLLLFAVAIVWNLGRGRAPDCHCFGQLHSSPAGWRTVARNLGLAALAAALAVGLAEPALAIAIAGVGAVALLPALPSAWRRAGTAAARAPGAGAADRGGLPVGTPAPGFRLPALQGLSVTLDSLRAAGQPVLLLFTDPGCGPCIELAPQVARWQREHSEELTIAVIERRDGPDGTGPDEHGRRNVLFQRDGEAADAYRALGTPTAVLVGPDGAIASPVAGGSVEIEALVARNVERFEPLQLTVVRRKREPAGIGLPFIRRELLVRGAGAWAATSAVLAWPLRTAAGASPGRRQRGTDLRRCDHNRDCGGMQACRDTPQGKRCVCKDPLFPDECGQRCENFDESDDNCGECGVECLPGRTCAHRDCVPGDGSDCPHTEGLQICCDGRAVNPARSEEHCGGCASHPRERWRGRRCTRGKTPACCGGNCVDLDANPRHCGSCYGQDDPPCKRNEVCFGGRCRDQCPAGTKRCGESSALRTCFHPQTEECCESTGQVIAKEDMQFDEENCGACGANCPDDPKYMCCPNERGQGTCVNTHTSPDHCNGCNQFCSGLPGEPDDTGCECGDGECKPRPFYANGGCTTCPCI